jgi:methyl-accepting chemotaxis protein
MFKNLQLWAKITLATGLAVVLVGGVLTFSSLSTLEEVIGAAERQELNAHVRHIGNSIEAETRMAEAMSALVANMPQVREWFATGDRQSLGELLVPSFKVLKQEYGVAQFQFHTPPATSFFRVHKPARFGDDLSAFRHTVIRTNKEKQPTRGLEKGRAGLGARGMVPLMQDGSHLGSVEFGMSFGQSFFDNFKSHNNVEVALYLLNEDSFETFAVKEEGKVASKMAEAGFKTFAYTLQEAPLLGTNSLKRAMAGQPEFSYLRHEGKPLAVYVEAINDFSGQPIGVLEVAMDRSKYTNSLERAKGNAYWVGLFSLGMGLLFAVLIARGLARRINIVVDGVRHVAEGDLTVDICSGGRDEIGHLAAAAQEMRRQLHDIAAKVLGNAEAVHRAATEITGAVENQAATSSEMSASVAEITSTMEELSASSSQIAEHAKSVVDTANQTWNSSKEGTRAMGMVLQKMEEIRNDNQDSMNSIMELGHKSKEITKVMEIINAVADQTKLIAFNAALEASSAGDAGRRFGVVAAEIRRLADSVTESTTEVELKINEIQELISRLVVTSEKGAGGVEDGIRESVTTSERLVELEGAARKTTNAAQQISLSTQQQQTASNQVVVALREIVTASSNTAGAISKLSAVSKSMVNFSAELGQMTSRFKLKSPPPVDEALGADNDESSVIKPQ